MNSYLPTLLALFYGTLLLANNVQISNVSLVNQNVTNDTYQVKFDVSWENSWRSSTLESNYDAVWIFIKFRFDGQVDWQRGVLAPLGFVAPTGSTIDVSSDAVGAFLFRSSNGIGNVNFTNAQLQWHYGASGMPDDANVEISLFAIEMVYIPAGAFLVGDDSNDPIGTFEAGNSSNPYLISNENALTLGGTLIANLSNSNAVGMLTADDFNYTTTRTLPAAYPKGTIPFYIMKYEISQGQYAAFLNLLPPTATANRFPNQTENNGHTIANTGIPPIIYVSATPDRACNFLSWSDLAAYADWSGLRPMTELEYEKACRGTRPTVPDEGAWGTPYAFNQPYALANSGLPNETFSNAAMGTGNVLYAPTRPGGISQPRRCGIFSASLSNPSRAEAGASYYGVMEMSGNIWEMCITLSIGQGRNFIPNHGNGIIGSTGNSTVGGWPAITGVNEGVGTGVRGGGNGNPLSDLSVSRRRLAGLQIASRFSDVGGRLVRSSF